MVNHVGGRLTAQQKVRIVDSKELLVEDASGKEVARYIFDPLGILWLVSGRLISQPPKGKYQITNMYVDPESGKVVVEYDNKPVE